MTGGGPEPAVEALVSAVLDGEATEAERRDLEARLRVSGHWRLVLAETDAVRGAVRSAPWPEAPPGFWDVVGHAVGSGDDPGIAAAAARRGVPGTRRRAARRAAVWAGGAVAAALIVGVVLPRPSSRPVSPSVPSLVESHAARSSVDDPITRLAPVGVPVSLSP